jgi:hypothetical protein
VPKEAGRRNGEERREEKLRGGKTGGEGVKELEGGKEE